MMHLSEEDLVLLYYGEPGVPANARVHLAECVECRRAAEALAETLDACGAWQTPEPDPELARSVWAQLVPQMETQTHRWRWSPRWLVAGAAVAVLVVVAFVAGRVSSPHPQPALTAGLSPQARQRILAISVADHLDRAEVLITQVANANDSDAGDFGFEREQAKDLVSEGRLIRQTLANEDETATLPLLDDVERFMLEVANAPDRVGPAEMKSLQQWIGSDSLLFKVRIIESNLRNEGQRL